MNQTRGGRVVLSRISPSAWEHPADRESLEQLRKVPGFELAVRKVLGMFGEKALGQALQANGVRVDERQLPHVHDALTEVCRVLDVEEPPALYVSQDPVIGPGAVGAKEPFILLAPDVAHRDPDELTFILGREVGLILGGRVLYPTLFEMLQKLTTFGFPVAEIAVQSVLLAMRAWNRKSQFTADRAGLLAAQDPDAALRVLLYEATGPLSDSLDLAAFAEQADGFRGAGEAVYKALNVLGATQPCSLVRAAELREWAAGGDYEAILAGEYTDRSRDPGVPFKEDLAEASAEPRESVEGVVEKVAQGAAQGAQRFKSGIGKARETLGL